MSKKVKIFFSTIEGSGPLAIYWKSGPYGDAVEATEGDGVYWTSANGDLLGVQFDDVNEKKDDQTLLLSKGHEVCVSVRKGKVEYKVKKDDQAA